MLAFRQFADEQHVELAQDRLQAPLRRMDQPLAAGPLRDRERDVVGQCVTSAMNAEVPQPLDRQEQRGGKILFGLPNRQAVALELRFVPLSADFQNGDELVTSGIDGVYPPGLPVDIMIRPDDIDFIPHPDGDVVVVGRQFRGAEHLYRLRLTSGARVHSVQPSTTIYPSGTRVRIVANLLHVVAFPLPDAT